MQVKFEKLFILFIKYAFKLNYKKNVIIIIIVLYKGLIL